MFKLRATSFTSSNIGHNYTAYCKRQCLESKTVYPVKYKHWNLSAQCLYLFFIDKKECWINRPLLSWSNTVVTFFFFSSSCTFLVRVLVCAHHSYFFSPHTCPAICVTHSALECNLYMLRSIQRILIIIATSKLV